MTSDHDYLKEWLDTKFKSLEDEIKETREIAKANHETLRRYLWFWRGMKAVFLMFIGIVTFNWENVAKMLHKLI